jgi:hypothetical protein
VPLDVQNLEKADAVEAIEPAWRDLWEQGPEATPFQSPDWLLPWTRHLWGGGRLRVLRAQSPEMLDVRDSPCSICPVVSRPRDFDTLYHSLDGGFRRNLRTAEHRLAMEEGACDRANRKLLVTRATVCGRKIA